MKFFDLSQPIFNGCPGWPTYKETLVTHETVVGNNGFTSERLNLNTHTATHLDAPYHFFPEMNSIDEIPIENFIGKAILINLEGVEARHGIDVEDLKPYEAKIKEDTIVLLNTGWYKKRNLTKEYYNDWPYLTGNGAQWLLEKKIKGVGIDGLSMGGWYEGTGRPCHEILLSNNIWLLEELYFPEDLLTYEECTLHAVPLKITKASGSPTRAYAIVED